MYKRQIDECSMLTCKDFYVLMKALDLKNINRIILIGDPFQLPPIGPGRPFADLFNYLKDNKDEYLRSAITKLRYVVRTINTEDSDILTLASWFSGEKPAKNSDLIFEQVAKGNLNNEDVYKRQLVYLTTKIWGLSLARSWRTFTPFYGILRSYTKILEK